MTQVIKDRKTSFKDISYFIQFKTSNKSSKLSIQADSIYYCAINYHYNDLGVVGTVYIADYQRYFESIPPNLCWYFGYSAIDNFEVVDTQSFVILKYEKTIIGSNTYLRLDFGDQYFHYFSSLFKSTSYTSANLSDILNDYHTTSSIYDSKLLKVVDDVSIDNLSIAGNIPFLYSLYNLEIKNKILYCNRRKDIIVVKPDNLEDSKVQISPIGATKTEQTIVEFTDSPLFQDSPTAIANFNIIMNDKEKSQSILGKATVYSYDEDTKKFVTTETRQIFETGKMPYDVSFIENETNKFIELPIINKDSLDYIYKCNTLEGVKIEIEVRGSFLYEPLKKVKLSIFPSNYINKEKMMNYYHGEYTILAVKDIFEHNTFTQKLLLGRNYLEPVLKSEAKKLNNNTTPNVANQQTQNKISSLGQKLNF